MGTIARLCLRALLRPFLLASQLLWAAGACPCSQFSASHWLCQDPRQRIPELSVLRALNMLTATTAPTVLAKVDFSLCLRGDTSSPMENVKILMSVRLGWQSASRKHIAEMKLEVTTAAVSRIILSSTGWLVSLNWIVQIVMRLLLRSHRYQGTFGKI